MRLNLHEAINWRREKVWCGWLSQKSMTDWLVVEEI